MREKRNIILTMLIAGALAGIAAAMMFLSGFMEWDINQSSVPAMGFNGIAAAFLGGLNPIGAIFLPILFSISRTEAVLSIRVSIRHRFPT